MHEMIHHLFNKFKNQIDIWFFFGFLATFTLSIRKVLFFYPIQKNFNEYTGLYIYASDIFLILTLFSFIFFILYNNKYYLSKYKQYTTILLHSLYTYIPLLLVILSFISILWSQNQIIALYRSLKLLEGYIVYLYVIYRFIPIVPRGTIGEADKTTNKSSKENDIIQSAVNCSTWNNLLLIIIISGLFQSIIAIWQFVIQHSIGILWLKESIISPNMPGVAKVILDGHTYIRAYGLFPHPNILGGFLMFSIIITILYRNQQLFHVEQLKRKDKFNQIVPRGTILIPTVINQVNFQVEKLEKEKDWTLIGSIIIQIIALLLTFSKSAIIGLLIAAAYIKIQSRCSTWNNLITNFKKLSQFIKNIIVPRGTITCTSIETKPINELPKLFHVEQFRRIILSILISITLFFVIKPDFNSLLFKSLEERGYYLEISKAIISTNPLLGTGMGQFIVNIPLYAKGATETWQFQPVHNVFLLIWSELGVVGLGLLVWFLFQLFHVEQLWNTPEKKSKLTSNVPRGTFEENILTGESIQNNSILCNNFDTLSTETTLRYFQGVLLGLLFIGLFDHYLWDIWPGQVLLWLVWGVIAGIKNKC